MNKTLKEISLKGYIAKDYSFEAKEKARAKYSFVSHEAIDAYLEQIEWGNLKVAELLREAMNDDDKDALEELETRASLRYD